MPHCYSCGKYILHGDICRLCEEDQGRDSEEDLSEEEIEFNEKCNRADERNKKEKEDQI